MTRVQQIKDWIHLQLDCDGIALVPISGDASFRRYYRFKLNDRSYIVMDAAPEHEDCAAFIDISARLAAVDINVPQILAQDLARGFLLLTDLGDALYLDSLNQRTADDLYADALDALFTMQTRCEVGSLPNYDESLLRREMSLFSDWLLEKHLALKLPDGLVDEISTIADLLVESALEQPRVFVHRDYHCRNLLQTSANNPGVLDYQDAVLGPITYDLVSLFKDCYIKWPRLRVNQWAGQYCRRLREQADWGALEESQFMRWFDLMGVQRHLKAGGIFARLCYRDGKTGYLKDLPRTLSYILDLKRDYPELQGLCCYMERQVLAALEQARPLCAQ